jgi:hypothetical protein
MGTNILWSHPRGAYSYWGTIFGIPWIGWTGVLVGVHRTFKGRARDKALRSREGVRREGAPGRHDGDWKAAIEAAAIEEEHWFREGAEYWNLWQRLKSTVYFAFIHSHHRLWFPWPILSFYIGAGFLLTSVYRRTYRRTQSREVALREAAIQHYWRNISHTHESTARLLFLVTVGVACACIIFLT